MRSENHLIHRNYVTREIQDSPGHHISRVETVSVVNDRRPDGMLCNTTLREIAQQSVQVNVSEHLSVLPRSA